MIFQNDDDDNKNPHLRSNSVEHEKWSALLVTDRAKDDDDDEVAILFSSQKHLRYLLRVQYGRLP